MKTDDIEEAVYEAERFIERAKAALNCPSTTKYGHTTGTMKSGALRRSSLDLSRALSHMRRRGLI